jgi:hypothetical protein
VEEHQVLPFPSQVEPQTVAMAKGIVQGGDLGLLFSKEIPFMIHAIEMEKFHRSIVQL